MQRRRPSHGSKQFIEGVGTSKDTTSSVTAKAKQRRQTFDTELLGLARRTLLRRDRLCANLVRSTLYPSPATSTKLILGRVNTLPAAGAAATGFEALHQFCRGRGWRQFQPLVVHRTSQIPLPNCPKSPSGLQRSRTPPKARFDLFRPLYTHQSAVERYSHPFRTVSPRTL